MSAIAINPRMGTAALQGYLKCFYMLAKLIPNSASIYFTRFNVGYVKWPSAAVVMVAILVGCGGNRTGDVSPAPVEQPEAGLISLPAPVGLTERVGEIDPALMARLSADLKRAMREHDSLKRIATAPTSELSKVNDLRFDGSPGEGSTIVWSYRNQGDYDQNGEVNLADITPIVLYFGMAEGQDGWDAAQQVDGDGNGEINLADITPIATQYGNVVSGYILQETSTPENEQSWTQLDSTPFSTGLMPAGGGYLKFDILVENPQWESYLRVIPYFGNPDSFPELGIASNSILGWRIFTPDSLGNVGQYTSLCVVDGKPAISYLDGGNDDLKYVRATHADGSSWDTPQTPDSTGDVGFGTSLAVVDGNPAISYWDTTNRDLKYVRATNAAGSSWGTPQTIDSIGVVGYFTSLAVVDGNPAISYWDATNDDLKYVRATDVAGSSWGTPQTLDSTGDVGAHTSLAVVDGNPAISYYDLTNSDLKYVRATNADGSRWGTPQTLDSTGQVGQFTALCVVDGNPAISYWDATNDDLKYVRATDVAGSSWGTPQTLDSTGDVGWDTSLCVVDGTPAISYKDWTNSDLKYVRLY